MVKIVSLLDRKNFISLNNFHYLLIDESYKILLIETISNIYEVNLDHLLDYYFYINNKGKVYISKIDVDSLKIKRVNGVGLYFGTINDNGIFRPSIEGSDIIKPNSNYAILKEERINSYLAGESLFLEDVELFKGDVNCVYYILVWNDYYLGAISLGDKEIFNYVPKSRRVVFNKMF